MNRALTIIPRALTIHAMCPECIGFVSSERTQIAVSTREGKVVMSFTCPHCDAGKVEHFPIERTQAMQVHRVAV